MTVKRKILVAGATGNVGRAVFDQLTQTDAEVYAGVRDLTKAKAVLSVEAFIESQREQFAGLV